MKQVAITIKIDDDLKKDIQKLAKNMGLSFSAIVENKLRQVRRERRIEFTEELVPNQGFAKQLRNIEQDAKSGSNITGSFNGVDDLMKSLMSDEN